MFSIPRIVRFWTFIIGDVLSILCSLFVLYHVLFNRILRQNHGNYVNIFILCVCLIGEVTVIPTYLYFYQNADSWIRSKVFCEIQQFIDWSSYVIIGMLVAWSNIEKHIIIFHDKWISSFRKRLFLHLSKFLFYFHLFPSMY